MIHPNVTDELPPRLQSVLYLLGLLNEAVRRQWVSASNVSVTDKGQEIYVKVRQSGYKMPKLIMLYAFKAQRDGLPALDEAELDTIVDLLFTIQEEPYVCPEASRQDK